MLEEMFFLVVLDGKSNQLPKLYHQRQVDFVAFQIYHLKQPNFTRYTPTGTANRAWICYKIMNYIKLHNAKAKTNLIK